MAGKLQPVHSAPEQIESETAARGPRVCGILRKQQSAAPPATLQLQTRLPQGAPGCRWMDPRGMQPGRPLPLRPRPGPRVWDGTGSRDEGIPTGLSAAWPGEDTCHFLSRFTGQRWARGPYRTAREAGKSGARAHPGSAHHVALSPAQSFPRTGPQLQVNPRSRCPDLPAFPQNANGKNRTASSLKPVPSSEFPFVSFPQPPRSSSSLRPSTTLHRLL